jgi:hypothetical protein
MKHLLIAALCAFSTFVGWTSRAAHYPSYTLVLRDGGVLKNASFAPYDGLPFHVDGNYARVEGTDFR